MKMNVGKNAMGVYYVNFEGDFNEIKKAVESLKKVKDNKGGNIWRYFAPRKEWSCIGFDNEESFKNFLGACIGENDKDIKSLKPKAKDMKADRLALSKIRKENAKAYVEKKDNEVSAYFETKYDKGLVFVVSHYCELNKISFYKLNDKDFESIALVLTSEELNEALDINEGKNCKFLEKLVLASASVEDVESVDTLEEKKEIKKEKTAKKLGVDAKNCVSKATAKRRAKEEKEHHKEEMSRARCEERQRIYGEWYAKLKKPNEEKSEKVENKMSVENVDATIKALEEQVKELKKLYTKKQDKTFASGSLF